MILCANLRSSSILALECLFILILVVGNMAKICPNFARSTLKRYNESSVIKKSLISALRIQYIFFPLLKQVTPNLSFEYMYISQSFVRIKSSPHSSLYKRCLCCSVIISRIFIIILFFSNWQEILVKIGRASCRERV